jgi:hypothetical protein
MIDEEALRYADANGVPMPKLKDEQLASHDDQDAIAQQLQQVAQAPIPTIPEDGDGKTPKKGGSRKRKTGDAAVEDASKLAASPNVGSPDKKRRRASGKPTQEAEEPKKSGRKKTKSS